MRRQFNILQQFNNTRTHIQTCRQIRTESWRTYPHKNVVFLSLSYLSLEKRSVNVNRNRNVENAICNATAVAAAAATTQKLFAYCVLFVCSKFEQRI